MARYAVTLATPLPPAEAFEKVADLSRLTEWDPGVVSAAYQVGDSIAVGTIWKVIVKGFGGSPIKLHYEVTDLDPDVRMVAVADDKTLRSYDIISVAPDGDGSRLTYDAELKMKGLFSPINMILPLIFDKIGDKAAQGLVEYLDGTIVDG